MPRSNPENGDTESYMLLSSITNLDVVELLDVHLWQVVCLDLFQLVAHEYPTNYTQVLVQAVLQYMSGADTRDSSVLCTAYMKDSSYTRASGRTHLILR